MITITMNDCGIEEGHAVRLSIDEFEIVVKQYDEKENVQERYTVWVKSGETVEILKKKIENESGIWWREQILKWNNANGTEMYDNKTLDNYGIGNGTTTKTKTTVFLSKGFEIRLKPDNGHVFKKRLPKSKTISVLVNGTEKVEDVKKKIENMSGIVPRAQILKCNENGPEMEDKKTLKDYGIVNDGISTIFFVSKH